MMLDKVPTAPLFLFFVTFISSIQSVQYVDVASLNELPSLEKELRYFDFIGGTKEYRCFIVDEEMPRNFFLEKYEDLLDPCLKPIYKNKGICVRQDSSFALPGFYIVSPIDHFHSFDQIESILHLRLFFIIQEVRKGMREMGIPYVHLYYEEKKNASCNVHYWLLPIRDIEKHPRLYSFDIKSYLEQFLYTDFHEEILKKNEQLRNFFEQNHLLERDNALECTLKKIYE